MTMLRNVAVVTGDGASPFELALLCEVWGQDRSDHGVPLLDFAVCTPRPGRIKGAFGYDMVIEHDLSRAEEADLVCIAPMNRNPVEPEFIDLVRATVERGARVLAVCTGAFVLGEAGLLDGRSCTTHWMHTEELATRFPAAHVIPEVLYVDADPVITSAGTAAGADAALHLWRKEYGGAVASTIARRMVLPPMREGGQAQFIRRAVPDCDAETLAPLLSWIGEHLDEQLDVDSLARRSSMSSRTFARRFRDEVGSTPHVWITLQRVIAAEGLLETTHRPIERIAEDVGFGNAATLRHHFTRVRGLSPQRYRAMYCTLGDGFDGAA
jgi:transcriptional regulator GlxA family with amidase domain